LEFENHTKQEIYSKEIYNFCKNSITVNQSTIVFYEKNGVQVVMELLLCNNKTILDWLLKNGTDLGCSIVPHQPTDYCSVFFLKMDNWSPENQPGGSKDEGNIVTIGGNE